jgi:hypothetical protein
MMENRRILSAIFGVAQGIIGISSAVLAVMLFLNMVEIQTVFNLPSEFLPLCLLVLVLFGAFSIINGLLLIRERWN